MGAKVNPAEVWPAIVFVVLAAAAIGAATFVVVHFLRKWW